MVLQTQQIIVNVAPEERVVRADRIRLALVEGPELRPAAVDRRDPANREEREHARLRHVVLRLRLPERPEAEVGIVLSARPERA